MDIERNFYRYFDAAGRPFAPTGVVYTVTDVISMFVDARDRGEMPEIIDYRCGPPGAPLYAIAQHKQTGEFSVWEMNVTTGKPRQVAPPPAGPTLRKKKRPRPRLSREMKLWRAMKAWEER